MILQWMAFAALSATLAGLTAAAAEIVFAGRNAPRRWPWLAAILASIVLPVAIPAARDALATRAPGVAVVGAAAVATSGAPSTSLVDVGLVAAWILASLAFCALLASAQWRNRRVLQQCRRETVAGHEVLISSDFGPALVGVIRPRIVVPAWVLTLDANEQRLIVAHEREHATARDPLVAIVALAGPVLMPWNLALWWQLSRLRLAIELDCDMRVVGRRADGVIAYGQLLLRVGERDHETRHPVLALSHSRSSLAKRMDALLRQRPSRLGRAAIAAIAASGMLGSVAFIPAPNVGRALASLRPAHAVASAPLTAPVETRQPDVVRETTPPATRATSAPTPRARAATGRALTIEAATLPPVQITPSNPLSGVTVSGAQLPPSRIRGVVVRRADGTAGAMFSSSGGAAAASTAPTPSSASAGAAGGFARAVGASTSPRTTGDSAAAGGFIVRAGAQPRAAQRADTTKPPPF